MPLLTATDIEWLHSNYPALVPNDDSTEVQGELHFTATYDATSGLFSIVRSTTPPTPGVILSGRYSIQVKDVVEVKGDRLLLPRLFVEGVQTGPERHFNADKSGCLCGPSEEVVLLKQGYLFPQFLEELCIPFLYAQLYYDANRCWPWASYDHGTIGVLQSYAASGGAQSLAFTLLVHLANRATWPKVRAILARREWPKGHMPCLCEKHMPIRRCHPDAWQGLRKLHADVQAFKVALPPIEHPDTD